MEHFKNIFDTATIPKKNIVHDFRGRDSKKEIQPKMRFTASTQIERILDAIQQYRNTSHGFDEHSLPQSKKVEKLVNDSLRKQLHNTLQTEKTMKRTVS
eukprot:CAMPEP_0170546198 /NCGR_PEP_ID=MMETSP0211-20121228/4570_1 /TAXON_ID=311385 /ORGANISM="Pseudokeronopsis sp., Strain OXSARD2" /LENGTH=98 /DNA_ID=CAMNT_0010850543 /DNA_START=298 /DNA_END=594 /DNA_ORIENTATION=+